VHLFSVFSIVQKQIENFIQHNPPHPGEVLYDLYFEPLGLSVTEAAKQLFMTRPNLFAVIKGEAAICSITAICSIMAVKLAEAFDTSHEYWMNLQMNYDRSNTGP
jgi:antitoxin HigA-1